MPNTREIHDILTLIAREYAPDIAAKATQALIEQTDTGSIERTMAEMVAVWVQDHGVDQAHNLASEMVDYLSGDAEALERMGGDAKQLSLLTETYQALEAQERAQARAWARRTAVYLKRFAPLMAKAMLQAFSR